MRAFSWARHSNACRTYSHILWKQSITQDHSQRRASPLSPPQAGSKLESNYVVPAMMTTNAPPHSEVVRVVSKPSSSMDEEPLVQKRMCESPPWPDSFGPQSEVQRGRRNPPKRWLGHRAEARPNKRRINGTSLLNKHLQPELFVEIEVDSLEPTDSYKRLTVHRLKNRATSFNDNRTYFGFKRDGMKSFQTVAYGGGGRFCISDTLQTPLDLRLDHQLAVYSITTTTDEENQVDDSPSEESNLPRHLTSEGDMRSIMDGGIDAVIGERKLLRWMLGRSRREAITAANVVVVGLPALEELWSDWLRDSSVHRLDEDNTRIQDDLLQHF
ncbi:hypothetical protein BDZ89DRAFT_1045849 [Hymenopellis radicata]|nr:hypothetical protein BDZ89DRAFT_1045849 [Hymenopellis radicata]